MVLTAGVCRLKIANAAAVITQDIIPRGGKQHPLYLKLTQADAPKVFVVPANGDSLQVPPWWSWTLDSHTLEP